MNIFSRKGKAEAERKRRIVALFSDTHSGSEHGLLSPDTKIPKYDRDGNQYYFSPNSNAIQVYLWEIYRAHVAKCLALAGSDEVIPEHDGDLAQGTKHLDDGVMSLSVGIQKAMVEPIMRLWLEAKNVKTMRICEGTQAHDGLGNSMTYMVAEQLQAEYPGKDIRAVHHGLIDVDGYIIDYAHHGPVPGRRTWLKGNEARYYLRDRMMREIMVGRKPPDLYHRAHYHEPVIETVRVNGYKSMIVVTPSYSFPGAWTRQATASISEVVNGMMVLELENGKLVGDIHEYIERTDIRTREQI